MTTIIKLFLWEEVEGAKMTYLSHSTPIIITEGLRMEGEEGKNLETTEIREEDQKGKTKDYGRCERK